jgi:hypothetical protein
VSNGTDNAPPSDLDSAVEVKNSEIRFNPTQATYLRKALEVAGAIVLLGVIVATTWWLEADVLHETTTGDGLLNLVLVAVVAVFIAAGLMAGLARRARMTVVRMRHSRRRT